MQTVNACPMYTVCVIALIHVSSNALIHVSSSNALIHVSSSNALIHVSSSNALIHVSSNALIWL